LESPAELLARGAENDEDGDDSPEGDEDAEGVDPAVGAEVAAFLLRRLDEREAFDEEDGEDAGHEVEEDSADEGQGSGPEDGGEVGGRAGGCGEGAWNRVDFVGGAVRQFEEAVEILGRGLEVFIFGEGELDAVGRCLCGLRGCVGDDGLIEGKELPGLLL
jgi:hypothetical protein